MKLNHLLLAIFISVLFSSEIWPLQKFSESFSEETEALLALDRYGELSEKHISQIYGMLQETEISQSEKEILLRIVSRFFDSNPDSPLITPFQDIARAVLAPIISTMNEVSWEDPFSEEALQAKHFLISRKGLRESLYLLSFSPKNEDFGLIAYLHSLPTRNASKSAAASVERIIHEGTPENAQKILEAVLNNQDLSTEESFDICKRICENLENIASWAHSPERVSELKSTLDSRDSSSVQMAILNYSLLYTLKSDGICNSDASNTRIPLERLLVEALIHYQKSNSHLSDELLVGELNNRFPEWKRWLESNVKNILVEGEARLSQEVSSADFFGRQIFHQLLTHFVPFAQEKELVSIESNRSAVRDLLEAELVGNRDSSVGGSFLFTFSMGSALNSLSPTKLALDDLGAFERLFYYVEMNNRNSPLNTRVFDVELERIRLRAKELSEEKVEEIIAEQLQVKHHFDASGYPFLPYRITDVRDSWSSAEGSAARNVPSYLSLFLHADRDRYRGGVVGVDEQFGGQLSIASHCNDAGRCSCWAARAGSLLFISNTSVFGIGDSHS